MVSKYLRLLTRRLLNPALGFGLLTTILSHGLYAAELKRIEIKGVYEHPLSKISFPERVGQFNRGGIIQFDSIGANVGVGYSLVALGAEVLITAYVYPVEAPQASPSVVLENQFVAEKAAIMRSHGIERLLSEADVSLSWNVEPKGKLASFSFEEAFLKRTQPVRSELYLFIVKKYFLKYRITYPEKQSEEVKPHIEQFLDEVRSP
jgi:hypothetical protein